MVESSSSKIKKYLIFFKLLLIIHEDISRQYFLSKLAQESSGRVSDMHV